MIALLTFLIALADTPIKVVFFGDLMMAGMDALQSVKNDPIYPFRGTLPLIETADIAIANLECPFGTHGTRVEDKEFTFLASPKLLSYAKSAGFDGFGLANNHIMDFGPEGLEQTISILDSLGIKHCGAGEDISEARRPMVFHVRGKKIAVLAYSNTFPKSYWANSKRPGTAFGHAKFVRADIAKLRDTVDFIVVFFHWGAERLDTPKTYQKSLAHIAIDSGADLVIGSHPHVVQGFELYHGKPIFYSLGNYAFRSATNSASGMALMAEIYTDSTVYKIIPLEVRYSRARYSPYPDTTGKLLQKLKTLSFSPFDIDGDVGKLIVKN